MHTISKLSLAALAAVCCASVGQAQNAPAPAPAPAPIETRPPTDVKVISKDQIAEFIRHPGTTHANVVVNHENYNVEYVTRPYITNHVENHTHFVGYFTVLDGEGIIAYGGKPADPDYGNPAEPHATTMTDAKVIALHVGDFIVVPAGTWYFFSATQGHTMTYVLFKQRV
jgi:mannose-6-phosphate isomerase-like protein (cupin superfamily)